MKDEPLTLEFTKTDSLTGDKLDGATFRLTKGSVAVKLIETASGEYRPDPNGSDTFTTANGKAVIRYLPAGTYKVEETAPPVGFMPDKPQDITITLQNGTSNPLKTGMKDAPLTLEFQKLDSFTQKPMDGAVFKLLDVNGVAVKLSPFQNKPGFYKADPNGSDTFTTKDGKATLYYLPEGKYTVHEAKAAEGYATTPDKPVTVLITNSPDNPATQSMRDEPLALEIRKLDATDGLPVGGASFSLTDESGKIVKVSPIEGKDGYYRPDDKGKDTFEVDATGMAKILYLPYAVYQVKETKAPPGFAPSKEAATVTVRELNSLSNPAKLDVKNQPLMFELLKIDAITKEPLPGVSFTLMDEAGKTVKLLKQNDGSYRPSEKGSDTFISGPDGYARIKYLPVGKYTVKELEFEGYIIAAPLTIEITEENTEVKPVKLTMENMPTKLIIEKLDDSSKKPLDGAVFRLMKDGKPVLLSKQKDGTYRADPKGSETFTTDKGIATLTHIPLGKLTVEEVTPPTGYAAVKPVEAELTGKHGADTPLKISISDKPYALTIHKVTKDNKPLAGAGFTVKAKGALDKALTFSKDDKGVYRYDPTGKLTTIMVDNKGEATVLGLPTGEYELEETVVPEGYFPAAPQKIIIKDENTTDKSIKATVVNETFVKLGFDSDRWRVPLAIALSALTLTGGALLFILKRKKRSVA